MNALTQAMRKTTLVQAGRRFASTVPKAPIPEMYQSYSFRKAFMGDPSTYPLIAVMLTASFIIVGMSANALTYKGVRISPEHKRQTIPDWDREHVDSVTKKLATKPVSLFYSKGFKDIQKEGLGMDHEEWKKSKEAYSQGK